MAKQGKQGIPIWPAGRRLLRLAGRHKLWLFAAIVADVASAAVLVAQAHAMRHFFDGALLRDAGRFWLYMGIGIGLVILDIPLQSLKTRGAGTFSERTLATLRRQIAEHAAVLSIRTLEARHSGDLLSILNADLARLKTLTGEDILSLIGQAIRFVGAFVYILTISWPLTLVSTLMTPLTFWVISRLTRPVPQRTKEMQDEIGVVNSVAQDSLGGLMIGKAFNLAGIMDRRFRHANRRALEKGLSIARLTSIVSVVSYAAAMSPFLLTCAFGGYLVIRGQVTFGSLIAFINLLNWVANPLSGIPRTWASMGEAAGAAQRVYELLDQEVERRDGRAFQPAPDECAAIRFHGLSFAYEEEAPVLRNLSLSIQRGQTVAIVGPSGSGKSTILKLLLGFYPVPDDRIRLWGHDLNAWQLPAARAQMAYVAQDTYLFPVSVAENIACGRPEADRHEIEAAARAANIHDFVATLPEGYDTTVGERGAQLSGGQRQRLSLARAILRDAPILLLDEPTSALDTESEALVQQALDRTMAGRTTVVVAHRLSTIVHADRVLVLDAGRIVEAGTHQELLAQGRLYEELYRRQFAAPSGVPPGVPAGQEGAP
jgi:ABC-type multidrug transport system fused ATPase/permease subunit